MNNELLYQTNRSKRLSVILKLIKITIRLKNLEKSLQYILFSIIRKKNEIYYSQGLISYQHSVIVRN